MKIIILGLFLALINISVLGQAGVANFTALPNHSNHSPNGNGNLGQTFNMTACGLNYMAGSVRIETRDNYQTVYNYHLGNGFPDSLLINGVVGGCNTVVRAYLYWSESYFSGTLPTQTVVFRDPLGMVDSITGSYMGVGGNKCWGEIGSYAFRVDATPYITANGYYNMLNVLGVANPSREVDGFTLLVIYQDASASYEGTLIIDDGAITVDGGAALSNVTNFMVCGNPGNERGFVIASDMQDNLTGDSVIINGITLLSPQDFWEDDDFSTVFLTGQTNAQIGASSTNDCYMIVAEGVYYQTNCLGCMPSALQANLAAVNSSCDTSQLGNASVTITSGTPPFTIDWSTGNTNVTSISNLNPGNYSVTITDANGCSTVLNFTIGLGVSNLTFTNAGCPNFDNGTATVNPSGNGPYTFEWSTGATPNSITGLTAGTYFITITDGSNCSWIDSATITGTPAPNPVIIGQAAICQGDTSILSVGNYLSYIWNTGATTNSISVTASGTYCVTVSTGNNCTGTACFTVTVNPSPQPLITQQPTSICGSGTVTLNAGAGYSSYSWNTGASSQTINPFVSSDTSFRVTVTNSSGCSGSSTINISVAHAIDPPVIIHNGSTTICPGDTLDLLVRNSVTGGPYSSYLWTNGGTDQMDTAVIPTSSPYCVTVTDSNGCTAIACINITILPPPEITLTHGGPQNLCGTGPILLNAGAWSSYLWNTGATTDSISVSTAGTYCVTITDSSGCTGSACINVTAQMLTSPLISANGPTAFCNGDSVSLDAGQYGYYIWSNGATSETITVNTSGNYCVTATEVSGCSGTACIVITVNQNPTPMILSSFGNTFCGHGTANLHTSSPYSSYLWSNGNTNSFINENDTVTTSYSVTVTDINGCTGTASLIVTVNPSPPIPIINSNATAVCNGDSATLIVTGGNYISYTWNNGATTDTITVTSGGYYYVTVIGNDGCTAVNDIYIYPTPTVYFFNPNSSDLCSDSSRILTANPSEQASSYLWNTGETTQSITIYSTGIYSVTITGQNSGCTASAAIDITTISLVIFSSGPTSICQGSYVYLSPGNNYQSWQWSDGSTNYYLDAYTSGMYCVTVTDFSGCNATACIDVTVNPNPSPTITRANTICNGDAVSLATGSYSAYNWNTGNTTEIISITNAGNYSVTVTDTNGCTGTASIQINSSMNPSLTITPSGPTTLCNGDSVNLDAGNYDFNTNTYFASYLWNIGATVETITVSTGGIYCVTVSNIYGCTSSACITITNGIVTCSITPNGPTIFCAGDSVILDAGTWSHYNWSTGQTTETITVDSSGSYCVIVSDNNDCTCVACIDIQVTGSPISINCGAAITVSNDVDSCNSSFCLELPKVTGCGNLTITVFANNNVILNYSNGQECACYPIGTTTLTWMVTDSNGNSATCLQAITVNDTTAPQIICPHDLATCDKHPDIGTAQVYESCGGIDTVYNNAPIQFGYGTTVVTWTAIDIYGNTATCIQNVTIGDSLNPFITANPTTFCAGDTVTLDAGSWHFYTWNTGDSTETITVTTSGIYCVTVGSIYGCTGSACIEISISPYPTPAIIPSGPTTFCPDDSVTLNAGSWSSYIWSNGATTSTITIHAAGDYCVTVSNENGCTGTACQQVNVMTIVPVNITEFCHGDLIRLAAGSFATYLWNTGATTDTIYATTSGIYSVSITNASGCTGTDTIPVIVYPHMNAPVITGPTSACAVDSITICTQNYAYYNWSTGATTSCITATTTNTYYVTVSNGGICNYVTHQSLSFLPNPVPIILQSGSFCNNGFTTIKTGATYASYTWSNGASTQATMVNTASTYTVTVTSINGCTGTAYVTLTNVCDIPTNLFTNNIGSSYGMANWTQPACHYNYTIRISLHNLNSWTTNTIAANTHYTFSGLASSTTYDWQIRNNCDSSQNNVSSFSSTQVFTTLAHREFPENGISSFEVYPNPAYDHVIVTFNSDNEANFKLRLIDVTGRIILNEDFQVVKGENQTELNLSPVAKGVYFIVLEKGEMILQTKLVIQ